MTGMEPIETEDAPSRAILPKARRDWASLIANIGVIVGLLFLGYELVQSRIATAASIEIERSSDQQTLFLSQSNPVLRDAYVRSIREPDALTDADMIVLDGFLAAYTQQWGKIQVMMFIGLADEARLRREIEANAGYVFGTRFAQAWWEREKLTWGTESPLYEIADPIVRDIGPDWMADRLDALAEATDSVEAEAAP